MGEGMGEGLSQDMVLDNDIAKELLSVDGGVNANLRGTRFVAAATVQGHTATKKIGKKKKKKRTPGMAVLATTTVSRYRI